MCVKGRRVGVICHLFSATAERELSRAEKPFFPLLPAVLEKPSGSQSALVSASHSHVFVCL